MVCLTTKACVGVMGCRRQNSAADQGHIDPVRIPSRDSAWVVVREEGLNQHGASSGDHNVAICPRSKVDGIAHAAFKAADDAFHNAVGLSQPVIPCTVGFTKLLNLAKVARVQLTGVSRVLSALGLLAVDGRVGR